MKYLVEFKTFTITEGGNAFPDAQSLTRAEVEPAFAKFQESMTRLFGEAELELIGSRLANCLNIATIRILFFIILMIRFCSIKNGKGNYFSCHQFKGPISYKFFTIRICILFFGVILIKNSRTILRSFICALLI